jgi:hypothetical protein
MALAAGAAREHEQTLHRPPIRGRVYNGCALEGVRAVVSSPNRVELLAELVPQLEAVRRDAATAEGELAVLSAAARTRALSSAERALNNELHVVVRRLEDELRDLERQVDALR